MSLLYPALAFLNLSHGDMIIIALLGILVLCGMKKPPTRPMGAFSRDPDRRQQDRPRDPPRDPPAI